MSAFDDLIKHRILLQRLGLSEAAIIKQSNKRAIQLIEKHLTKNGGKITDQALNDITKDIKKLLFKSTFTNRLKDFKDIAEYEAKFNLKTLQKVFDAELKAPSKKTITAAMLEREFKLSAHGNSLDLESVYAKLASANTKLISKTVKDAKIEAVMLNTKSNQEAKEEIERLNKKYKNIQQGIIVPKLVSLESGILTFRSKAIGITVINHLGSSALDAIYSTNKTVIELLRWDTMLDDSVCPDCEALEGEEWEYGNHKEEPPLHANCRCVLAPVELYEENRNV